MTLWPVVGTLMNVDMSVRRSEKGVELIGYCPKLPYSRVAMKKILQEEYGVIREIDDVVRNIRHYLEHAYLRQLLAPIIDLQRSGKVLKLQLGRGIHAEIIHAVVDVFGVMGDNQGLHQCAGVYSAGSNSKMPCRECEIPGTTFTVMKPVFLPL